MSRRSKRNNKKRLAAIVIHRRYGKMSNNNINFGILTVSDSCSSGVNTDTSGPNIRSILENYNGFQASIVKQEIVADEVTSIVNKLRDWSNGSCDVIITTGGTGFTARDVTPESTKMVIEKEAPGITIAIMKESLNFTPMAMLSRLVCGIRKRCLIVNTPGSKKASEQCVNVVLPVLVHATKLIKGEQTSHHASHCENKTSKRCRNSIYPMIVFQDALSIIAESKNILLSPTCISINDSYGSSLSEDVFCGKDIPQFDTSKMDGYAIIGGDESEFKMILGKCNAGVKPIREANIKAGECYSISTGAVLPAGTSRIIKIEDTELQKECHGQEKIIKFLNTKDNNFIRKIGSDMKRGSKLFDKGDIMNAQRIACLGQAGIRTVKIKQLAILKVSIFSTGDELVDEGDAKDEEIFDTNRPMILSLLSTLSNVKPIDLKICKDSYSELKAKMIESFSCSDIIISSGGVSMGEKDLIKLLLNEFSAKIHFGRVCILPGKPTTFATLTYNNREKLFFGLAGNPVSSFVGYYLFVRPVLQNSVFKESKVLFKNCITKDRDEAQPLFNDNGIIKCIPIKSSSTTYDIRNSIGLCIMKKNNLFDGEISVDTIIF